MALSKPQLGIQSPSLCQLCEQNLKISWKCLECDLLMCSLCKNNIHPKIKTAGEHKILAIKDISSSSPSSKDPVHFDITLIEEFQTKLDGVHHLAISLDDSLWIGVGLYKKGLRLFSSHTGLQKVKCEGNKLKVISSFNIIICGVTITPDNDLLISTNGSVLKQIKSGTNKIEDTVYNVDPLQPLSLYVTKKNKVIVGTWNVSKEQKSTVIVMDQEGNHEMVYGDDQRKDILFSFPWKITATNNDHIFVTDQDRVVVLGKEDKINTYLGHPDINTEDNTFAPWDLTTTPADYVIVVDNNNCALHILNSSGNLITYIRTKDKGIVQNPFSVGISMAGQFCMLYLGSKANRKDKSKLYKLNLVGC